MEEDTDSETCMTVTESIERFRNFLEAHYNDKIMRPKTKSQNRLTIDFKKLIAFDVDLGNYLLEEPDEALKACSMAAQHIMDDLKEDFQIRVRNSQRYNTTQINRIRSCHIGKMITVEGVLKKKSDVRAEIKSAKFECPACGHVLTVIQLDERKFVEPIKCSCGRKAKFRLIGKDEVDVFSVVVEEPTEIITGGTKLSQLKVLCRADLTNPNIERTLYQGVRVEITGLLKDFQVRTYGELTPKIDWYLEANYVKIFDESFFNIKWDDDDLERFNELASSENWLERLKKSIFYDIHGYEEECEGVILQMFGGVGKHREGAKVRGNFHILIIGDPGGAKSTILKIAQKFSPKAMYVAGTGVSGVGLTASAVKDELLGGYTLEAGALVLCSNGTLMLDELDKVNDEYKKSLHEPMAEETVSVSKANVQATLVSRTSILAAANPKHGSYSEYDSIYSQIDLTPTLINRFDLVYPVKESKLTSDDDYLIALKILGRIDTNEKKEPEFSREFVKKYISYSKTIEPKMPEEIQVFIANKYKKLKEIKRKMNNDGKQSIPVTGRNVDALRRIIESVARSRLHKVVTQEDAEVGYKKVIYCIEQVGIDPDSGEDMEVFSVNNTSTKCFKKKDMLARILHLIRDRTYGGKPPLEAEELIAILKSDGMDDEFKINEIINILKKNGDIMEPRPGFYSFMP